MCMCVCLYVYVCMNVCMYVCIYVIKKMDPDRTLEGMACRIIYEVSFFICMYVCMHICNQKSMYVCMYQTSECIYARISHPCDT